MHEEGLGCTLAKGYPERTPIPGENTQVEQRLAASPRCWDYDDKPSTLWDTTTGASLVPSASAPACVPPRGGSPLLSLILDPSLRRRATRQRWQLREARPPRPTHLARAHRPRCAAPLHARPCIRPAVSHASPFSSYLLPASPPVPAPPQECNDRRHADKQHAARPLAERLAGVWSPFVPHASLDA